VAPKARVKGQTKLASPTKPKRASPLKGRKMSAKELIAEVTDTLCFKNSAKTRKICSRILGHKGRCLYTRPEVKYDF